MPRRVPQAEHDGLFVSFLPCRVPQDEHETFLFVSFMPCRVPQDEHDELLFEHYGQSELVRVNIHSGEVQQIAPPRLYTE
eukprot:1146856-Pelagomonas_calceolata.AAC.2